MAVFSVWGRPEKAVLHRAVTEFVHLHIQDLNFNCGELAIYREIADHRWMGIHHAYPVTTQLWYFVGALCSESIGQHLTGYSGCPYAVCLSFSLRRFKCSKMKTWHTPHQAVDSGDQGWEHIPRTPCLFPQMNRGLSAKHCYLEELSRFLNVIFWMLCNSFDQNHLELNVTQNATQSSYLPWWWLWIVYLERENCGQLFLNSWPMGLQSHYWSISRREHKVIFVIWFTLDAKKIWLTSKDD